MTDVVATAVASNDSAIVLDAGDYYDFLTLRCHHVKADIQPSALLTAYLSEDGVTFDTGAFYNNDGLSAWIGEPNPTWWPQPVELGAPQTLNLGCRIGIDVGERPYLAGHYVVEFASFGSLNGVSVAPTYMSRGHMGFIGGAAGISPRPQHSGGGYWFPDNDVGTPFDWEAQTFYGGHWNKPGARIRAIKLTMDGGGTFGRLIEQGLFMLEGRNIGSPPVSAPPPTPGNTPIGDFAAKELAFSGEQNKASASGAWAGPVTSAYIGTEWDTAWAPESLYVHPSANDGFSSTSGNMTFTAYGSNSVPTHSTDGTPIAAVQADIAETTSLIGWPAGHLSTTPYKFHWVNIEKAGAMSSLYVSRVDFA